MKHCLAALDVAKLMQWWPGQPHTPHRDPKKVRDIQRSLNWKRVAQIVAIDFNEKSLTHQINWISFLVNL